MYSAQCIVYSAVYRTKYRVSGPIHEGVLLSVLDLAGNEDQCKPTCGDRYGKSPMAAILGTVNLLCNLEGRAIDNDGRRSGINLLVDIRIFTFRICAHITLSRLGGLFGKIGQLMIFE